MVSRWENTDETSPKTEFYTSSKTQFGYFFFGDIGYRYQRPNGFMFRVGVSPSFNFGDKYGLNKAAFFPYIGFGWSFEADQNIFKQFKQISV